jgi:hypothetical protein
MKSAKFRVLEKCMYHTQMKLLFQYACLYDHRVLDYMVNILLLDKSRIAARYLIQKA